jgi:hypothetical protein
VGNTCRFCLLACKIERGIKLEITETTDEPLKKYDEDMKMCSRKILFRLLFHIMSGCVFLI